MRNKPIEEQASIIKQDAEAVLAHLNKIVTEEDKLKYLATVLVITKRATLAKVIVPMVCSVVDPTEEVGKLQVLDKLHELGRELDKVEELV